MHSKLWPGACRWFGCTCTYHSKATRAISDCSLLTNKSLEEPSAEIRPIVHREQRRVPAGMRCTKVSTLIGVELSRAFLGVLDLGRPLG